MLARNDIIAFLPTTNRKMSREFYQDMLGLPLESEDPFALVFDANGTMLRVVDVSSVTGFKPYGFTVLGWSVTNIRKAVKELVEKGVQFQQYEGMDQDDLGVWTSPSGARIAWFADPDGNILSLTQH